MPSPLISGVVFQAAEAAIETGTDTGAGTGMGSAGPIAALLAITLLIMYTLRKLKLVTLLLFGLFGFFMACMVIEAVPALHIEPLYSMIHQFLMVLPNYMGEITDYLGRLLKGLGITGTGNGNVTV